MFYLTLVLLIAGFFWHRLLTKMGFKGSTLWLILITFFFPLTSPFTMIYLAFFPWPVHKELEKVKTQRSSPKSSYSYEPVDEVDVELDRMRGEMGYNQMKKRKPNLDDLTPKPKSKQKRDM